MPVVLFFISEPDAQGVRAPIRLRFIAGAFAIIAAASSTDCKKATPKPLHVAGAADLAFAFKDIGDAFEKKTGRAVSFSFGSTGLLSRQVIEGAPFDVFAGADLAFVDETITNGACFADSKVLYATGRIVMWLYKTKDATEVSWYRAHLETSLRLIDQATADRTAAIIDVGGGESTLVDDLIDRGHTDVTVLDISSAALEATRGRLGDNAGRVRWICGDATAAELELERRGDSRAGLAQVREGARRARVGLRPARMRRLEGAARVCEQP